METQKTPASPAQGGLPASYPDLEDFKAFLRSNLYASTTHDELSVERIFEVVDEIADPILNFITQKEN